MINFLLIILLAISDVHGDPTKQAKPGEFNYFVMVWYQDKFHCGGTIIDERHILVRGSCVVGVPSSDLSVIAGTVSTQNSKPQPLQVERVHIHYGFGAVRNPVMLSETHWIHDIAVLKLVNRLVWNEFTAPALLITEAYSENVTLQCKVPGWRHTYKGSVLEYFYIRWVVASTYPDKDCIRLGVFLLKNKKCASWSAISRQSTIHYYDGSPVVFGNIVIGIVDGERTEKENAFLNLFPYKDFIMNAIDERKYDVTPGAAKYVVSIWDQGSFKCGGIILDALHILTTGYCVQYATETDLHVIAGHTQVLENNLQIEWLPVNNIEKHPEYNEIIDVDGSKSMRIKNNNAVLTLAVPLGWGPTIGPVSLLNRYSVFTNRVCTAFRWHYAYTVDDKVLLQLVGSQEFIMAPEDCQRARVDLEADEICVHSQYAQHPRNLDSSGSPVECGGFVIAMTLPNFSTVPRVDCLTSVLNLSPVINSLSNICYIHPRY